MHEQGLSPPPGMDGAPGVYRVIGFSAMEAPGALSMPGADAPPFRTDEDCQQLITVPGIGPIISSAMVAAIGNGAAFCKGRDFAACGRAAGFAAD